MGFVFLYLSPKTRVFFHFIILLLYFKAHRIIIYITQNQRNVFFPQQSDFSPTKFPQDVLKAELVILSQDQRGLSLIVEKKKEQPAIIPPGEQEYYKLRSQ